MNRTAFTLIELLIVVAIIAILAAIAVPNFLEAQTRSRVARVYSDQRTLATAVESYSVDQNRAPIGTIEGSQIGLWSNQERDELYRQFTTPVAYITSVPDDPFIESSSARGNDGSYRDWRSYTYNYCDGVWPKAFEAGLVWYFRSPGPSKIVKAPYLHDMAVTKVPENVYDSTNGTISIGNILRSNKGVVTGDNL